MSEMEQTLIRIIPKRAEIVVESHSQGVISRKAVTPEALARCFLGSRMDTEGKRSGLLPDNCLGVTLTEKEKTYYLRHPLLYTDFSYYGTEYPNFPIPRLVFAFRYNEETGKVTGCRVCVVKDERLSADTPTYVYPFSNVSVDGRICLGNNALPIYKSPTLLPTLASFILRIPNNNDHFTKDHNKQKLEYRDLLEQMRSRTPGDYYTDILVPNGKTLGDFMEG